MRYADCGEIYKVELWDICLGCDVFLAVNGIFTQFGITNTVYDEGRLDEIKESILLRPYIDTTFQLAVFGNTDNKFYIIEGDDRDGFDGYRFIYQETKFIPKSGNLLFNITFWFAQLYSDFNQPLIRDAMKKTCHGAGL